MAENPRTLVRKDWEHQIPSITPSFSSNESFAAFEESKID
jgi:hypothetical protein